MGGHIRAHQCEVVLRGSLVVVAAVRLLHEAVAAAGLHPRRTRAFAKLTEADLEVVTAETRAALGQVVILEDDLHLRPMLGGLVAHGLYVALDVVPVTAERLAEVDDHVDLGRAVAAGQLGLVTLRLGGAVAMRKADDRADEHAGAAQQLRRALHRVRFDAHGSHAAFRGEPAAILQLLIRHRGMQERVVDHLCELLVGVFHGKKRRCCGKSRRREYCGKEFAMTLPTRWTVQPAVIVGCSGECSVMFTSCSQVGFIFALSPSDPSRVYAILPK